nr:hypothetical protein [Tanacetum cinerariifolium]
MNSSTIVSRILHTNTNGQTRMFQLLKKAIERLKQGKSINVQDLKTNLYWEFGKFTSPDGESLESCYSRFYKMMNERVRNQCDVTNHQVNVQFLLQLQPEWKRDDTDDEPEDQELEAHYMYMAQLQEQKSNKFFETSNKALVDKLKGEIADFKTKNKHLESSNNHFKEANNELSKTNQLLFEDLKKFEAELDRYNDVKYASKVEIDCAKAKGDLMSYKMESKSHLMNNLE